MSRVNGGVNTGRLVRQLIMASVDPVSESILLDNLLELMIILR